MRSRWNDADAAALSGVDLLVYASRLVGAETSLVVWGGGNTSIKTRERDHRGRDIAVLRVKGSGSDLKSAQRKDFPGVRMDDIAALLDRDEMSDEEMVGYLAHTLQEPGGVRPSIETLLHGFRAAPVVVLTHAYAVAPRVRGLLGRKNRVIVTFDDSPGVTEFVSSVDASRVSQIGPATPDHTIYAKRLPCFVAANGSEAGATLLETIERSVARFVVDYTRYFEENRFEGAQLLDPLPRVVLVPGLGMFTAGKDRRTAGIVSDIYHHTINVLGNAGAFGDYVSLSPKEAFDVEYWPLELYKPTLAPPEKELARRIALVTGGGSGIGRAVARRLAAEGAHVVVGDVDGATARKTADEIVAAVGAGRALGLEMDVTREASVRAAFEETVLGYGGLDILVSNAGIAHSSPVARMELADWERSFAVNSTGHFLVAREAMRLLTAQGLGGALVFVATKNVMSPGKDFAAYSAAKAAEAQLAKVLALEGAPHGIRSNIVNPDAVFQDSKLWSAEIRRERAAAQGISVDRLEDFYRKRNLLGVGILLEDVAEAVLFLASDRSAKTTGCTVTVDGGVRDAFPR